MVESLLAKSLGKSIFHNVYHFWLLLWCLEGVPDGFSMVFGSQIKSWEAELQMMMMKVYAQSRSGLLGIGRYGCPLEIIFMPADTTNTISPLAADATRQPKKPKVKDSYHQFRYSATPNFLGPLRGKNPHFIQKFTYWKSQFLQNSHFWNLIFHKIHTSEISIFTKFTCYLKSHFSQNWHFWNIEIKGISV